MVTWLVRMRNRLLAYHMKTIFFFLPCPLVMIYKRDVSPYIGDLKRRSVLPYKRLLSHPVFIQCYRGDDFRTQVAKVEKTKEGATIFSVLPDLLHNPASSIGIHLRKILLREIGKGH